jgi:hypothetical protein
MAITQYPEMDEKREFHPPRKPFWSFLALNKEIRFLDEGLFSFPKPKRRIRKTKQA